MDKKFPFDTLFQEEILRFVLNNSDGWKALQFIDDQYFVSINHSIIFKAIGDFYKSVGGVPTKPFLRNRLVSLFSSKTFAEALVEGDRRDILVLVEDLFTRPVKDGENILIEIVKFASFIDLRDTIEKFNLENFEEYPFFLERVEKAIHKDRLIKPPQGTFLIQDIKKRQLNRQISELVIPSPFYQLNRLTSAGGFAPGSTLVILDRPKKLKTTFLVNVARMYLARKKKVFYADLENGEMDIITRLEQSVGRVNKKEIIKGVKDQEIQKVLRRYKRIGGELFSYRFPGYSTTRDFEEILDLIYKEHGFKPDLIIIDYIGLMGALSGKQDDFGRIGDAYIDVANLALKRGFEVSWTAHHILRSSNKRERTRYYGEDIAKCIDIIRHAHGVFGLNRSITEEENSIVRLEIVDGRETVPYGRAYFSIDVPTQRTDELTRKEVQELTDQGILYNPTLIDQLNSKDSGNVSTKRVKDHGDI